ncbi:MAG TPA: DUF6544 family protein [Polyangiaceae bacterium]|nr:DUF6544 family protein [Polyangiaceae bacterium]
MRLALSALIALHGLIHILGFLKWSGLAEVPQLSGWTLWALPGPGRSIFSVLWLAVALLLSAAAALRWGGGDAWSGPALNGVALSQLLIVLAWKDAKFGTIANLIVLLPALAASGHARFSSAKDLEIQELLQTAAPSPRARVTLLDLQALPEPVARWLQRSGVIGRERVRSVRLKQRGELRTSPEGAWMPTEAEQYFVVDEPAFVWTVDARMGGVIPIVGRDRYAAGRGHMLVKVASLYNVVDAGDEKIARGAMLRFLGEIVWFPSAALSQYLEWNEVDDHSAQATMRHAGLTTSAVFHFDALGRVVSLTAERYLGGGPEAKLTPWFVACSAWHTVEGIEVPVKGDVRWKLPGGEFSYYRWEVVDINYDRPELYARDR